MKFHKLTSRGISHLIVPLIFIVGFAVVGSYLIVRSHASTPTGSCTGSVGTVRYGTTSHAIYNCKFYTTARIYNVGTDAYTGHTFAAGTNWVMCQVQGSTIGSSATHNNWWAFTESDQGTWGWVNAYYAAGGGNNEKFSGGVPVGCPSAFGLAPGQSAVTCSSGWIAMTGGKRCAATGAVVCNSGYHAAYSGSYLTCVVNPPTPAPQPGTVYYRNPFHGSTGLSTNRIDQGVDMTGSGRVYAFGNGTVTYSANVGDGWNGAFIIYQLADGPYKGRYVYVAEECTRRVSKGAHVDNNTNLCDINASPGGFEMGWAPGPSNDIALAKPQYAYNGFRTTMGVDMAAFIHTLGGPRFNYNYPSNSSGSDYYKVPAGFPYAGLNGPQLAGKL